MAGSSSPIIIELSSDSESGFQDLSQTNSDSYGSQPVDDIFTSEWTRNDYAPSSVDDLPDVVELATDDVGNVSVSSAETEIYVPVIDDIIVDDTPEKCSQSPKKRFNKNCERQNEQLLKQQKRLEQKKVREEKKAEELKQKKIKAALAQQQKNLKPEENIKLITIKIDTNIVNSEFGGIVITSLQQSGLHYEIGNQMRPNVVFWVKQMKDILLSDEGIIEENAGSKEENQLLYLISSEKTAELVYSNELITHIELVKSIYVNQCVTVVITGIQKYFDEQKKRNKEGPVENDRRKGRKNAESGGKFSITPEELQWSLIELQLIGNCNHCLIETGEELASLIITTTKSLSQLDYRREKHKRDEEDLDWFAKADSKQCIKVDKNGTGLSRLWQQQICQFNSVGIEIASAIVSNYQSPHNLVAKYKNCSSTTEAELLLQNIQIRRDAGILSSSRRIGPEVSKKLYKFYMSNDPEQEL